MNRPQIKICGLTDVTEALNCANAGADAIGLVFFEKSPRNVSEALASQISKALPEKIASVGVFVNESYDFIINKITACNLDAVQLHGDESPVLVSKLIRENVCVIKALYMESEPRISEMENFEASSFLVECAKGSLPGGNALSWNFSRVKMITTDKPLIIAGGLSPDNIKEAVLSSLPDIVDVSSGVESSPGKKDIIKAKAFINNVRACNIEKKLRRLF